MTDRMDEAQVREEVERLLPALRDRSEDELRVEVGGLALGNEVLNPTTTVGRVQLLEAGERVAKPRPVREIVCDPENRKAISETLTIPNVSSLVLLLLGVFNVTVVAVGIVALAILLIKIGLQEYCRTTTTV